MFQPAVSVSQAADRYAAGSRGALGQTFLPVSGRRWYLLDGIRRRWLRERRRRQVGRAYDMAREIARVLPVNSRVLDVGCGNGFVAHHLTVMLGTKVIGIDLDSGCEAAIEYRQFDGRNFPLADGSVDAALLCYVLHHAQGLDIVMSELKRVLSNGACAVIYEDIPESIWDRLVCWTHDLKWRKRTGPCTFRQAAEWRRLFKSGGFEIVSERQLSRWRNLTHPVRRRSYVLKLKTRATDRPMVQV